MRATVLAVPLVALVGCWLVARALRRRPRPVRAAAAVLTAVVLLAAGLQLWALAALHSSAEARAIVWRDADVDDIGRFPSRVVEAGPDVLPLTTGRLPGGTLATVTLRGGAERPLDRLVKESGTRALVVLRGDEVVHEQYADGGAPDRLHTSFSVAKSFLSTLVGIAVDRGEIRSLDEPVTAYVPELVERDERFTEITLRHLLTMSSGLAYEERSLPWSDDSTTYYAPDLRAEALTARIEGEPGARWHYNNYNPLLMGLVLERATGTSVAEYLSRHLWQPLGAEADASWSLDSRASGFEKMESGFNAVARDYARFGYLFAHEGRIGDRQVLDPRWVAEATAADGSRDPALHYQYWWWIDPERPGRFFARGNLGQYVYVDPASDVVVVRLGSDTGGHYWVDVLGDIADRVQAAG